MNNELTIRELKHIIKELEDDLDLYLTLKQINFYKTQPGAVKFKEIMTNQSMVISDRFAQYVIRDEEYDETIFAKHQSLLAYQQRLLNKLKNISTSNERSLITYLREEERLTWKEICKITHYSDKQARRIYQKGKDDRQ